MSSADGGARTAGPTTGQRLRPAEDIREVDGQRWSATQSQLYGELNKLADDGLIEVADIGPRGRKEYRITPAGRDELQRWVMSPENDPPFRDTALLRVFLLGEIEPEQARKHMVAVAEAGRRRGRSESRRCATPSTGPTATACSSAVRHWSTAFAATRWKRSGPAGSSANSTGVARSRPIHRPEVAEYWSCTDRLHRPDPIYRITHRLQRGRTADVPCSEIPTIVSAWLAELGVRSPLVEDLARAVSADDWPAAYAIGEFLSVDVTVAAGARRRVQKI